MTPSGAFSLDAGDAVRSLEVPAASPLFAGHFPGRPILPGIAHLDLVCRALEEVRGGETALAAVRSLKLRRPVAPGDRLELRLGSPGEDGAVRFALHCGGVLASQGTVEVAAGPYALAEPGRVAGPEATYPPPEALLPHGPPARLVRGVIAASAGAAVCAAEIPLDHPLARDGRAPAYLALEAAAQAAAALEALGRRGEEAGPRVGYLVGIRDARFSAPWLPAGRPFRVAVRLEGEAFPLSMYAVSAGAGEGFAAGVLSTFLAADPPTRGG